MRDIVHDISQLIIAVLVLVGGFIFLYKLFFGGVPVAPEHAESLLQVTGGVIGFIGTVIGFYLGTSLSSARKDQQSARITELAMAKPAVVAAPPPTTPAPQPLPPDPELARAA